MKFSQLSALILKMPKELYRLGLEPVAWLLGVDAAVALSEYPMESLPKNLAGLPYRRMANPNANGLALVFRDPAAEIADAHSLFSV